MEGNLQLWLELLELQHRYVQALDSGQLEAWPTFFTPEASYTIISKENSDRGLPAPLILCRNQKMMRDRVLALRHANIYEAHTYRHAVDGLVIKDIRGEEVKTTSSYVVVQTGMAGDSVIFQAGCYEDTLVKVSGAWLYREKRVVYDSLRVQTLLATPI